MLDVIECEKSSFRDLSGFVFRRNNILYRQINECYKKNYEQLMTSGLYETLIKENLLVFHDEVNFDDINAYKIIKPQLIDFVSYPYEWSFSMLKDASLTTLNIQEKALQYGMSLKDASVYNIQFTKDCKPIFIDTLSFEIFEETSWKAYGQFCRHFLAPLLLMTFVDMRFQNLLKSYIDGIPLDFVAKILPLKCKFNPSIFMNIYFHSKSINKFKTLGDKTISNFKMLKSQQLAIIQDLKGLITSLKFPVKISEWGNYYEVTNYSQEAFLSKQKIINEFLDIVHPKTMWDFGANDGTFSKLASKKNIFTTAFDIDYVAVENNYLKIKNNNENNILPLVLDLTNPSPAIGWANSERKTIFERSSVDLVLMLALVHHLYFSNNLSFNKIAEFVFSFSEYLIIEFIPKEDSQIAILTIFKNENYNIYNMDNFEKAFSKYFDILQKVNIENSDRILYLMKKNC